MNEELMAFLFVARRAIRMIVAWIDKRYGWEGLPDDDNRPPGRL